MKSNKDEHEPLKLEFKAKMKKIKAIYCIIFYIDNMYFVNTEISLKKFFAATWSTCLWYYMCSHFAVWEQFIVEYFIFKYYITYRITLRVLFSIIFLRYSQNSNALRVYFFVFEVMHTLFHFSNDLVLISLNDKIIIHIL